MPEGKNMASRELAQPSLTSINEIALKGRSLKDHMKGQIQPSGIPGLDSDRAAGILAKDLGVHKVPIPSIFEQKPTTSDVSLKRSSLKEHIAGLARIVNDLRGRQSITDRSQREKRKGKLENAIKTLTSDVEPTENPK